MNIDLQNELMASEQLQAFSVVEIFCEVCQDLTAHHLDDSKVYLHESQQVDPETVFVDPLSSSECTICRENEESYIDNFDI